MYLPLSGKLPANKGSHEFIEDMLGLLEARHSLVEITKRQGGGGVFRLSVGYVTQSASCKKRESPGGGVSSRPDERTRNTGPLWGANEARTRCFETPRPRGERRGCNVLRPV